jgi:hypothetical protein
MERQRYGQAGRDFREALNTKYIYYGYPDEHDKPRREGHHHHHHHHHHHTPNNDNNSKKCAYHSAKDQAESWKPSKEDERNASRVQMAREDFERLMKDYRNMQGFYEQMEGTTQANGHKRRINSDVSLPKYMYGDDKRDEREKKSYSKLRDNYYH